jgi:hypothetical protein
MLAVRDRGGCSAGEAQPQLSECSESASASGAAPAWPSGSRSARSDAMPELCEHAEAMAAVGASDARLPRRPAVGPPLLSLTPSSAATSHQPVPSVAARAAVGCSSLLHTAVPVAGSARRHGALSFAVGVICEGGSGVAAAAGVTIVGLIALFAGAEADEAGCAVVGAEQALPLDSAASFAQMVDAADASRHGAGAGVEVEVGACVRVGTALKEADWATTVRTESLPSLLRLSTLRLTEASNSAGSMLNHWGCILSKYSTAPS